MALTNKQVHGVCNMFANAFVNAKNEEERKKILIDFEDAFGRSIVNWKAICGEQVRKLTSVEKLVETYEMLVTRNDDKGKAPDCEVRLLTKEDFEQVREIVNAAFDMSVTKYDEPKYDVFVDEGFSLVACKDDEILGVILAHLQPDLSVPSVYINSFAVAEHARGNGIGKALFAQFKKQVDDKKLFLIKLQTDPNIPDRQNIYSAALGLYNSRIVKLVNKKGQLKSSIIIDELPTIYFRGIDNLIATARSNKVAVCLGFQDYSQLARDYGDKEAKVIQNTVGNIFSGQVVGETAKNLSERFGKILQQRQSVSINRQDTSTSINTQLDFLIPASKISNLSQGTFVGSVADNFGEEIDQKIFHSRIIVDSAKASAETKAYKKIPIVNEFKDDNGNDIMQEQIERNYSRIKDEVEQIVQDEMERIKADPELRKRFLPDEKDEEDND